ncbi:processed acidic surface protein [Anoxybacillus sp. B7M1]|jgi:processed acidic surface protein|uniref:processed acidic surface protein n=1 Tax=unclassified Anoxybacillus TaxID=2639704 RepID=UPI0005CCB00E|nr:MULTISPECIES: processed acidic surface protein [unclassified Anoxybacillus]ANB59032.1 processed acidic surface protein [Anoxybacillus sp. B2M1]ANB65212.1 processed acidic surface protein [Anoxybacillus sp. B7M1]
MRKKFIPFALATSLAIAACPVSAFAMDSRDPELQSYLNEIGMTVEELEEYLADSYDYTLDDFDSVDELRAELGDALTEENLAQLLNEYGMTEDELKQMLIDNGELEPNQPITDVFKFYNELADYVEFFHDYSTPITDERLNQFLQERHMTKDQLLTLLKKHGESLEDYSSIGDLADAVDYYQSLTPLTEEALNEFLSGLGLTKQQLEKLLAAHGDSLSHYTTVEELAMAVVDYLMPDLDELGLTNDELEKLYNHFGSLNLEDPQFASKMEEIGERLAAIGAYDFTSATELSPAQLAEIADVLHDMLDLFELDVQFYLTKAGEKKPLSLSSLLTLESTNGYDLLIEIYNKQGEMLADFVLTADMFNSDLFEEVGNDVKQGGKVIQIQKQLKPKPVKRTETGAKLPKTAAPYAANMLAGVALVAIGAFLFRARKGADSK